MSQNKEQGSEISRLNEKIKYLEAKLHANQSSLQQFGTEYKILNNQIGNMNLNPPTNLEPMKHSHYYYDRQPLKLSTPLVKRRPSDQELSPYISFASAGKERPKNADGSNFGYRSQDSKEIEEKRLDLKTISHRREKSMLPN